MTDSIDEAADTRTQPARISHEILSVLMILAASAITYLIAASL